MKKKTKGWLIGGSTAVAAAALTTGLCLGLAKPNAQKELDASRLTTSVKKEASLHSETISQKSADIYNHFVTTATPLVLGQGTVNQAFSLVDAFLNLALTSRLSEGTYQKDILAFFGCSQDELDSAASEIIRAFAVPFEYETEKVKRYGGGFSLNSLWINPSLGIRNDSQNVLKSAAENYLADVFHVKPQKDRINEYNQEMTPEVYGVLPKVDFADDSCDAALVSTYDVLDSFTQDELEYHQFEYTSGTHKTAFTKADGTEKQVDYLQRVVQGAHEKIGNGFTGVDSSIVKLGFSIYKANDGVKLGDIIAPAVKGEYSYKDYGKDAKGRDIIPIANTKIPYFNNSSALKLRDLYVQMGLACMDGATGGALASLVTDPSLAVVKILQNSLQTLDYHGFVSKSVTVEIMCTSSEPADTRTFFPYDYDADQSFLYGITKSVKVGDAYQRFPLVYGTIVDPVY